MAKYKKKPVIIEAYQTFKELDIETLEGTMHANIGDFIITGVHGEQYPCKPDIFRETYEPVEPYAKIYKLTNWNDYIPDGCKKCPNHPINGGSGICHCTLGAFMSVEGEL